VVMVVFLVAVEAVVMLLLLGILWAQVDRYF
jgi:hypothetical protein